MGRSPDNLENWRSHHPRAADDRLLTVWLANVDERWHEIAANHNERTRRLFRYYLSVCAGGFRARHLQFWQGDFSRGRLGRYDAPRSLSRRQIRLVANLLHGPWKIAYFQETIPPRVSTGRMFVR